MDAQRGRFLGKFRAAWLSNETSLLEIWGAGPEFRLRELRGESLLAVTKTEEISKACGKCTSSTSTFGQVRPGSGLASACGRPFTGDFGDLGKVVMVF